MRHAVLQQWTHRNAAGARAALAVWNCRKEPRATPREFPVAAEYSAIEFADSLIQAGTCGGGCGTLDAWQ